MTADLAERIAAEIEVCRKKIFDETGKPNATAIEGIRQLCWKIQTLQEVQTWLS